MLTPRQVLDSYFPEVRAKLIEIAAVMDRLDRAGQPGADERLKQYAESLKVLTSSTQPNRAEKIQLIFSDHS
jgi:hypothetical protein